MPPKIALLIILLCGALQAANANSRFDREIQNAEDALARTPVFGDMAFFMGQSRRLRSLPALERDPSAILKRARQSGLDTEYELWKMASVDIHTNMPPVLIAFPDIGFSPEMAYALHSPSVDTKALFQNQADDVLGVMKEASTCKAGMDKRILGNAGYEYLSTHQLFAAFWAFRRGCITTQVYRALATHYATRIYNELMTTQHQALSDIQVERTAILCLFKLCRLVPNHVIDRILEAQQSDGLWRFNDAVSPAFINHEHASFLAMFTLAAYQESLEEGAKGKRESKADK